MAVRIAIAPGHEADWPQWSKDAVADAGIEPVSISDAEAILWYDAEAPELLGELLNSHSAIRWVALPWAGVEPYIDLIRRHPNVTWTCSKGAYGLAVAELAVALLLAGLRNLASYARSRMWTDPVGRPLAGESVTVIGAGGIGAHVIDLLKPFRPELTVVRRTSSPIDGVRVLPPSELQQAMEGAVGVVLAAPLTPETEYMITGKELSLMDPEGWFVNVGRGKHVVTDDLVEALATGIIGGAALDVTDPEPLPNDHPLWTLPNCLIAPHVGGTHEVERPLRAARITDNIRRFGAGEALLGRIDPQIGY